MNWWDMTIPEMVIFESVLLWDGLNRMPGKLELSSQSLVFHFAKFTESQIEVQIDLKSIQSIRRHRLYELEVQGIELSCSFGRKYIFILRDYDELLSKLKARVSL